MFRYVVFRSFRDGLRNADKREIFRVQHSSHDSFPRETNGFSVSLFHSYNHLVAAAAAANYRDLKLQNLRGKDRGAILQNPRRHEPGWFVIVHFHSV